MTGTVYITNKKNSVGKIIFENNKESAIIQFPQTFDNGDTVDVLFQNEDISSKVIKMIAFSQTSYGFVMNKELNNAGSILVTYPKMHGLVFFYSKTISGNEHLKVSFQIKKTMDGKTEAINIEMANKEDFFKCQTPLFGNLATTTIPVKEGFVKDIIKTSKVKNMNSGIVSYLNMEKDFGFIIPSDKSQDIYFKISQYQKFYNKDPHKNDEVNFVTANNSRGIQLKNFTLPEQFLPIDDQYGMVENYKFCLKEYKKKYKREAEIGDLVIYTMKNETIEFKDKKENIKTILFKQREKVAAINTIRHGVVTTVSEHFGFIESNGEPIYFSLSKFKKLFNREPKKGEHLSFEATKSEKGTQVNSFVKISQEMSVTENTFQNFVQIDPTSLYYVYTQNGYAKEVYKYNPEDLSQSITCYNDRSIEKKFKIMSIDCLLEHNYSNKKISIQILKEEKNEIINGFVVRSIEDNDFEKALKYETLLQTIVYSPSRLKRIAKISQIPAYVLQEDTTSPIIIEQIKNSERLEVITGDKKIQLLGNKECYFVDLHEHHPVQNISPNDNWDIKLEIPPQVNNLFAHGERWKIKIKD